jgi:hypothetical protein
MKYRGIIQVVETIMPFARLPKQENSNTKTFCVYLYSSILNTSEPKRKSVYQAKKLFQQNNLRIKINGNKTLRQLTA